jgi:hypothetical protein
MMGKEPLSGLSEPPAIGPRLQAERTGVEHGLVSAKAFLVVAFDLTKRTR